MPFPKKLGKCAIVGSSRSLQGKQRGGEIDEHETVIKMNRLPTGEFFDDMGKKTDVYFKNLLADYKRDKTKVWYMDVTGAAGKRMEQTGWCLHESRRGCPFKAVLFEGASAESQKRLGWAQQKAMAFPYVYQSDDMHKAEHSFALFGTGAKVPS